MIVASVTGDDAHVDVRRAAEEHALEHGCAIILYVVDAASVWSDPMPNQWGSEGEGDRFGSRLSPNDLEALGRADVRDQVIEGRATHVQVFAWLPKDIGSGALAQYAREQGAHLVVVADDLEDIDQLRDPSLPAIAQVTTPAVPGSTCASVGSTPAPLTAPDSAAPASSVPSCAAAGAG